MKTKKTQIRHGDVLLTLIEPIASAGTEKQKKIKKVIVAEGEITGHAHVIEGAGATMLSKDRLRLPKGGGITHEEHGYISLVAGIWQIVRQQEWISTVSGYARVRD